MIAEMVKENRVLVTGATGFVGRALCKVLIQEGYIVRALVRRPIDSLTATETIVCNYADDEALYRALTGVDYVIHLAARAHVLSEKNIDPALAFREVNVDLSLRLMKLAMTCDVKRLVYVSSIGVNGSFTEGRPFDEQSPPDPDALYAQSKYEAERALQAQVIGSSTQLTIVRPPLVYAAEAPGNFHRLLRLVRGNMPLPFARLRNRRSLIALENLTSFLEYCLRTEAAAGQTFVISDTESISTEQLCDSLATGMGIKCKKFYIPRFPVSIAASVLGKKRLYTQLFGDLEIDSRKARELLGWTPVIEARVALQRAGALFVHLDDKS